jgi:hypothetical protein
MAYFPEDFPWKNKGLRELLGSEFERADGTKIGPEALQGKVLGLYFSADWCAPCKQVRGLKAARSAGGCGSLGRGTAATSDPGLYYSM